MLASLLGTLLREVEGVIHSGLQYRGVTCLGTGYELTINKALGLTVRAQYREARSERMPHPANRR